MYFLTCPSVILCLLALRRDFHITVELEGTIHTAREYYGTPRTSIITLARACVLHYVTNVYCFPVCSVLHLTPFANTAAIPSSKALVDAYRTAVPLRHSLFVPLTGH